MHPDGAVAGDAFSASFAPVPDLPRLAAAATAATELGPDVASWSVTDVTDEDQVIVGLVRRGMISR